MKTHTVDRSEQSDFMVQLFGGPRLAGELEGRRLSPQQSAFLALVYGHRRISRPEVSRLLWRRDADRRTRASIRQLRHQVTRRAGLELVGAEGDELVATAGIEDDLDAWNVCMDGGQLLQAARLLKAGFLPQVPDGLPLEFIDWRDGVERRMWARLESAARASWVSARAAEEWDEASDAAEAIYLLQGREERDYQQIIEARAKSGRLLGAEVAYADYVQHLDGRPIDDGVEDLMERVRILAREHHDSLTAAEVPFVGRKDELKRLNSAVERVKQGEFTIATVSGESGIGKTRLLAEVRKLAQLDGVRCLTAQPVELEKRISLNPILDAISEIDLEPHLTRMGEPWRTVVGAMLPSSSPSATRVPPPPIDESALSRRLLDAFSLLLHSLAEEEATILFIDDLQWVDATTMAVLEFYGRRWFNSRLGVVGAVRLDLVGPRDSVRSYVNGSRSPHRGHVELSDLGMSEARQLLELASASTISEAEADALIARVGQHPQYLLELGNDPRSWSLVDWPAGSVPISLKQIASNRLATLTAPAADVADLLSVVGKPIPINTVSAIIGLDEATLSGAVSELLVRRLATYSGHRIGLAHGLFESVLYLNLTAHHREGLHRRYAKYLTEAENPSAGEMALHLDRGGQTLEAAGWAKTAGEGAFAKGAMVEAAVFFELAARGADSEVERARASARQGTALFLARDLRAAVPALALASERLRNGGLLFEARTIDVRLVEALASLGQSRPGDLVNRLATLKDAALAEEDWESLALALDAELRVVQYMEGPAEVSRVLDEMRSLATTSNASAATVCKMGLGMEALFGVSSDPDQALRAAKAAVQLSKQVPRHRLAALQRCLVVLQLRGRIYDRLTQELLAEARELAMAQGDRRARYSIESNFATGLLDAGDIDRAEHHFEAAEVFLGSGDMDLARFHHWSNLAEIGLARADYETARSGFEKAQQFLGDATPPYSHTIVEAGLGICALETGDLAAARRHEASLGTRRTPYLIDPTTELTFRALLLDRRQLRGQALDALTRASERYDGRAEPIWLKLAVMRCEKMIRWGLTDLLDDLLRRGLTVSEQCAMPARIRQFENLRRRRVESGPT